MPGTVFVNPNSGPGETSVDDLTALFPDDEVLEIEPDGLEDQLRRALDAGASFIGVAGGDGTIRCAAEVLADGDVPLLAIPAGTRNHFAKQLGVCDLDTAAHAAVDATGRTDRIDVGEVNGRTFVNNSSIGLYPKVVERREAHERRMPKKLAQIVATWEQVRHGHRFVVRLDGESLRAWMVFIGNGRYGDGLLSLADRSTLADHELDVRVIRADRKLARIRVVASLLTGRLSRSPLLVQRSVTSIELDLDRGHVEVSLDGEVESMDPPLRYRSRPAALAVRVPCEVEPMGVPSDAAAEALPAKEPR